MKSCEAISLLLLAICFGGFEGLSTNFIENNCFNNALDIGVFWLFVNIFLYVRYVFCECVRRSSSEYHLPFARYRHMTIDPSISLYRIYLSVCVFHVRREPCRTLIT